MARNQSWLNSLVISTGVFLFSAVLYAQETDVPAVEAEMMRKAAQNIEKHRKADVLIRFADTQGNPVKNVSVEIRQVSHEFLFGSTIFDLVWVQNPHEPELYRKRFKELFNFAVFPFYWARYEQQQGITMRTKTLETVKWCRENGIATKGHPLAWTNRSGVPKWLQGLAAEETEELLLGRVKREVSGFAGRIDIWDVVNEAVNTRTWTHAGASDYIQEPIDRIADYVEKAFKTAHQANPKAHLVLNEYNTIAREDVRERFYLLVVELKRRQTPISGLGIQAHEPREHWYPPREVWATFEKLASLGYPLHITEFIPQSGGKDITGGWRRGKWTEDAQAEFAEQFFRLSFGHPAMVSINWWGLSDRRIWLPGGGLITKEYEPKPVYKRLRKLLHDEWRTNIETRTDERGTTEFRGFHGKYVVTLRRREGKSQSFEAALTKGGPNEWEFAIEGR